MLAVEGEILISYGVYANDRITTPPSPIRVPPPLTRGGKGSRVVGGNLIVAFPVGEGNCDRGVGGKGVMPYYGFALTLKLFEIF